MAPAVPRDAQERCGHLRFPATPEDSLFEIQKLCTAAEHAQGFQPSLQPRKSYLFLKAAELQQPM